METGRSRRLALALWLLAGVLAALAALAAFGGRDASAGTPTAHASHHLMVASPVGTVSAKEVALRDGMRKLWEDHITWTRLAIISLTTGSPDQQATVARLLRNQSDIGNAIKPYYGAAAGKKLTALLRQHILIAADLIGAAVKGDQDAVAAQQARWTANADQIAAFLSGANPAWKPAEMKAMMHDHLRLTTNEVVARLQKRWVADVRAYDAIHVQILRMADMLSTGIVAQFPGRFR